MLHYQNEFNRYRNDIRDNEMISMITEIEQNIYFLFCTNITGTFFTYSDKCLLYIHIFMDLYKKNILHMNKISRGNFEIIVKILKSLFIC